MAENEQRRRAYRQERGRRRQEEILGAAGALFTELGYDHVSTNMIAERAGVSSGSLYQFFPNKEAIGQAYAAAAVARLHEVYDAILAPVSSERPLSEFIDGFIDELVAFNADYPGYLALSLASTLSPSLAAHLQRDILERMDALLAVLWPQANSEQRRLPGLLFIPAFLGRAAARDSQRGAGAAHCDRARAESDALPVLGQDRRGRCPCRRSRWLALMLAR